MKTQSKTKTAPLPKMPRTRVQGTKVRYLLNEVKSDKPPLLICNGLGQSIEILKPLMAEISDRTVVCFDMPGIGKSEVNCGVHTIPDYAEFTLDFMSKIGIEDFDILGISWGGAVAQHAAYVSPKRVGKLVLAITSAGGVGSWWGTPIALSEVMFPMRFLSKSYGDFIGPWMYGGVTAMQPDKFKEYAKHAIRPSVPGYFSQVRAMCSWTSLPWLNKLKQPTMVIAGKYDGLIPFPNQMILAERIPQSELHVFQSDHLLMFTKRHEVGALIRSFLS